MKLKSEVKKIKGEHNTMYTHIAFPFRPLFTFTTKSLQENIQRQQEE